MRSSWLLLAATDVRRVASVLCLPPASLLAPLGRVQRTRWLVAQQGYGQQQDYAQQERYEQQGYAQQGIAQGLPIGWVAGVDEASGVTYYYHEQTGESQWVHPAAQAQQGAGAQVTQATQVIWRLAGSPGVTGFIDKGSHFQQDDYALPYTLRNGDEQVLSRGLGLGLGLGSGLGLGLGLATSTAQGEAAC